MREAERSQGKIKKAVKREQSESLFQQVTVSSVITDGAAGINVLFKSLKNPFH